MPEFDVITRGTDLPVVAFSMSRDVSKYDVYDVSRKLRERLPHAARGPGQQLPPLRCCPRRCGPQSA